MIHYAPWGARAAARKKAEGTVHDEGMHFGVGTWLLGVHRNKGKERVDVKFGKE